MHMLGDPRRRVQRDRGPDEIDVGWRYAPRQKKVARRIRAIDFKPLVGAAVFWCQSHVMEHRTGVKEFRIKPKPLM
jgi:hypothetical protein